MAGWTDYGKQDMMANRYRGTSPPTNYYIALVTDAVAPGPSTTTLGTLTEIAANTSGGYQSGGYQLSRNATDFDVLQEIGTSNNWQLQVKDVSWQHATESIPRTGSGARYAVLTDDNATIANRRVLNYWDLSSARQVSANQPLTLQNLELDANES